MHTNTALLEPEHCRMAPRLAVRLRLRQLGRVNNASLADAALVVLGHGTDLNDQSAVPVLQHAAELRRRQIFAEVREAFWKQEPQVKNVLASLSNPRIFIAPLFISEGYFAGEVIPKDLGFDASRITRHASRATFYCQPVGTHESMTRVILTRAAQVTKQFPFPRAPKPAETTLFIAGHGTERNANSRKAIEHQAEVMRAQQIYAAVHAVFMEEDPRIAGCHALAQTKNCVVVPFFISDGLHVVEDIPVLLGEPERIVKARLAADQPTWRNPTEKHGKLFWYSPSVGTEPGLADVILERVLESSGSYDIPTKTVA
jgi:sirohydrochlorin cobaltochelatase